MYHINPTFVHVDKDMAEIRAVKEVWDPKVQLCWWHLRKAVRERFTFTPLGKANAAEIEESIDSGGEELVNDTRSSPPPPTFAILERLFCAHPLIPGYSALDPLSIHHWAVKQTYGFFQEHDLRELWAYLWENRYQADRCHT